MKNTGPKFFIILLGLSLFFFPGQASGKAKYYKKGITLNSIEKDKIYEPVESMDFFNYKRMTTLRNIEQLGEKETVTKNIGLRVAQLLKENNDTKGYYYFNLAKAYEEKAKYDKAIENYKQAIKNNYEYTPAYLNLALIYTEQGNYKDAIKSFEKYISLSKNNEEKQIIKDFVKKINNLDEY